MRSNDKIYDRVKPSFCSSFPHCNRSIDSDKYLVNALRECEFIDRLIIVNRGMNSSGLHLLYRQVLLLLSSNGIFDIVGILVYPVVKVRHTKSLVHHLNRCWPFRLMLILDRDSCQIFSLCTNEIDTYIRSSSDRNKTYMFFLTMVRTEVLQNTLIYLREKKNENNCSTNYYSSSCRD